MHEYIPAPNEHTSTIISTTNNNGKDITPSSISETISAYANSAWEVSSVIFLPHYKSMEWESLHCDKKTKIF